MNVFQRMMQPNSAIGCVFFYIGFSIVCWSIFGMLPDWKISIVGLCTYGAMEIVKYVYQAYHKY